MIKNTLDREKLRVEHMFNLYANNILKKREKKKI